MLTLAGFHRPSCEYCRNTQPSWHAGVLAHNRLHHPANELEEGSTLLCQELHEFAVNETQFVGASNKYFFQASILLVQNRLTDH